MITLTVSYSATYGNTPRKFIEEILLPYLDDLEKNPDKSMGLRITGRHGKITGIHRESDEGWDGEERREKPR